MHRKLAQRRRAISNWRRLKVVLAILAICGNRFEITEPLKIEFEKEKKDKTFDGKMKKFVSLPTNKVKMAWDVYICIVIINALFDDAFF